MKQCQTCRTTYTDDSLRYCLADGGPLLDVGPEIETVVRPGMRVEIDGPASNPRNFETSSQSRGGMSTLLKVIIALVLAGFIGLILLGGAGVFYYLRSAGTVATVSPTPTPNPTPASTPTALASSTPDDTDDDSEDLEKEIAALQKKLEEMVNAAPGKQSTDDGTAKAIVNSPNDGFLALRDAPAEAGNRLAKIPHGTIVNLENCEKDKVRISGRSGRWCMVTYQDETGWLFDAWLVY